METEKQTKGEGQQAKQSKQGLTGVKLTGQRRGHKINKAYFSITFKKINKKIHQYHANTATTKHYYSSGFVHNEYIICLFNF